MMNKKYAFFALSFWALLFTDALHADSIFLDDWEGKRFIVQLAKQGGYLGYPRNYSNELTHEEKSTIRYIVISLANKSLISIGLAKGELEAAGNRIEHVHPLRFLMAIFTDEELKVAIKNIKKRYLIWGQFVGPLKESLSTEKSLNNITSDMITHFAETVEIDKLIIMPSIIFQRWDEFIDLLITHIRRHGDHDRYDG